MSSATSTDAGLRPWHFFVLAGLMAATAGVVLSRDPSPARLILTSLTIGAAALTGLGLYRTLWPLAAREFSTSVETVGGRTREAIEREKTLVLRSIKELEFDFAMGKVSQGDFDEMATRLRARAIGLMRQLDEGSSVYRELIERELKARVKLHAPVTAEAGPGPVPARPPAAGAPVATASPAAVTRATGQVAAPAATPVQAGDHVADDRATGIPPYRRECPGCYTENDPDARYCKNCGLALGEWAHAG